MELTGNVPSKYRKCSGDIRKVPEFIGKVPVKELCQGIVN
jgi:hypothetical protein